MSIPNSGKASDREKVGPIEQSNVGNEIAYRIGYKKQELVESYSNSDMLQQMRANKEAEEFYTKYGYQKPTHYLNQSIETN